MTAVLTGLLCINYWFFSGNIGNITGKLRTLTAKQCIKVDKKCHFCFTLNIADVIFFLYEYVYLTGKADL